MGRSEYQGNASVPGEQEPTKIEKGVLEEKEAQERERHCQRVA